MAFALDTLPTPEEFAANWYQMNSGQCMDCTADQRAHPGYQKLFLPLMKLIKDTPPINGVPQVKYVNPFAGAPGFDDDPTLMACYDRANSLALDNPAWAKKAGQDGLMKVATVCMWEARGNIPDGYMQDVVTALANKPMAIDKRWLWGGAAAVAYLLFFRR